MKRVCFFLLVVIMLFALVITVAAQELNLEFYDVSIVNEVNGNADVLDYIVDEILNQAKAIIEATSIESVDMSLSESIEALNSFDINKSIRVAQIGYNDVLEQLSSISNVVLRISHDRPSEDIFNTHDLEYFWKIPVLEMEDGYLIASVRISSPDDIAIWSTMVNNKELNDVTYLFNRELVPSILGDSGLNIDYGTVLPITIPVVYSDIIFFTADFKQYAIAFSARPDLLGIENGKIYEYVELESFIDKFLIEMYSGSTNSQLPIGGGGSGSLVASESGTSPNYMSITNGLIIGIMGLSIGVIVLIILKKNRKMSNS